MKKLSLIFTFMLICSSVALAQQSERQLIKEARKKEQDSIFARVERMVNDKSFVIAVDKIDVKSGISVFVNRRTNFILIDGEDAVLQITPNNSARMGPNGLGGMTVIGRAYGTKITTHKNGNLNISMAIQGVAISAQVSINIPKGGDKAIATVVSNVGRDRMVLKGQMETIYETNISKGRISY